MRSGSAATGGSAGLPPSSSARARGRGGAPGSRTRSPRSKPASTRYSRAPTSSARGRPPAGADSIGRGERQEARARLHGDQRPEREDDEVALALELSGQLYQ